jgi:hypothetical protein
LLLRLGVAALAAIVSSASLAQTEAASSASAASNAPATAAPDPRVVEAERRLVLSRRRAAQTQRNEQYNQMIMAGLDAAPADADQPDGHRAPSKHRVVTPKGHPAPVRAQDKP